MAKFPVEYSDSEGVVDAVNYLLSGPSGLGQNFEGFSAYVPAYIRPASRQPWDLDINSTLDPSIYLSIPISNITIVGGNPSKLIQVTFTTPFADPPFQFGDRLDIKDVIETGSDTSLNQTSDVVYSCTTTDVTLGYNADFEERTWDTYVSGGTIGRDFTNYATSTDCNGRVTVSGATTQVFVSAQLNLEWEYTCTTATTYNVIVQIARLKGFPSTTPGSNDYLFADSVIVSKKNNVRAVTPGSGTQALESIFTTVLDGPNLDFGYYWYILEVYFAIPGSLFPGDAYNTDGVTVSGTKVALVSDTTYSGITPTSTTGAGTGAVIDVTLTAGASAGYNLLTNTTIDITNGGSGYLVDDILTIPGTSLGGTSPDNDMTLVVYYVTGPYDVTPGRATTGLRSLTAQVIKQ